MSQLFKRLPDDIQSYVISFIKPIRLNKNLVNELICVTSTYKLSRIIYERAALYNTWASWYNAFFELTGVKLPEYVDDPIIQKFDSFSDMYELYIQVKLCLWLSTNKKNHFYLYPLTKMPFIQHFFNEETGLYETKVCHRTSIISRYELLCFCRIVSNMIHEYQDDDVENDEDNDFDNDNDDNDDIDNIFNYMNVDEIKEEYFYLTEEEVIKYELIAGGVPAEWF